MGSEQAGTVTAAEAARILKVHLRTLRVLVRRGVVRPIRCEGRAHRFDLEELAAAVKVMAAPAELRRTTETAQRALLTAEAALKSVAQIYTFLGLDCAPLSVGEEEIIDLYLQAKTLMAEVELELDEMQVLSWARTLLAMDETYLRTAEDVTADPQLWKLYFDLAQRLCEEAPRQRFRTNKPLESAYGFLEVARRSLRAAAFFFVRQRRGHDVASRLFPDGRKSLDDGVIRLLFPH